jgi:hypothetical protein
MKAKVTADVSRFTGGRVQDFAFSFIFIELSQIVPIVGHVHGVN